MNKSLFLILAEEAQFFISSLYTAYNCIEVYLDYA